MLHLQLHLAQSPHQPLLLSFAQQRNVRIELAAGFLEL
jgi:hypothetical protein